MFRRKEPEFRLFSFTSIMLSPAWPDEESIVSISSQLPLLAAAAAALLAVLFFFFRKKDQHAPLHQDAAAAGSGIPEGFEEEYQHGVAPCESGRPVMYTLHTCRHCVHLKDFLEANGIEHHLVYVDDFEDPARREVMATLRTYNPRGSFPTLVLPDGRTAVGFRESLVRELLGLGEKA